MLVRKFCSLVILLTLFFNSGFCQGKNIFGIHAFGERSLTSDIRAGVGLSYERKINRIFHIETGIAYRSFLNEFSRNSSKNPVVPLNNCVVLEEYLSLPVLLSYNSRSIKISAGPTVDFFIGWKDKAEGTGRFPYEYDLDKRTYIGLMTKFSRTIHLGSIQLEPEIRFNPIFTTYSLFSNYIELKKRQYIGIGVSARFRP